MPSAETFSIPPIGRLLKRYLAEGMVIVDPFARNSKLATLTNDLNPATTAEFHLEATAFLDEMLSREIRADAVLFDPPYSSRQVAECYQGIGKTVTAIDTQVVPMFREIRNRIDQLLKAGGVCISCGWSTNGMGIERKYDLEEILLVPHGGIHNDTIVMVERKIQANLF